MQCCAVLCFYVFCCVSATETGSVCAASQGSSHRWKMLIKTSSVNDSVSSAAAAVVLLSNHKIDKRIHIFHRLLHLYPPLSIFFVGAVGFYSGLVLVCYVITNTSDLLN